MTVKSQKHVHKYYKSLQGQWTCAFPDCTHFLPLNVVDTITNRLSVCWGCGEMFQLNELAIKDSKPKCMGCSGLSELDQFLSHKGI